ncbi:MAG: hypothetical protein WAL63_18775 [Solirubrobacteraceae bacterium]
MPTTRARHTLTETDELSAALDEAARRWPEDASSRSRLLLRLVKAGQHALAEERERQRARRLAAVKRTAGALTGVYPPDYLEQLRAEWPE